MPLRINGLTTGSVTLAAPDNGGNTTLTLPSVTDTLMRQGGGKILQIVRATDSTLRSTTSTSYVDVTGMSVTITPQRNDSAILIIVSVQRRNDAVGSGNTQGDLRITDSSNNPISGAERLVGGMVAVNSRWFFGATMFAWATPATTNATTYKLRFQTQDAGSTAYIHNDIMTGQIFAIEVSA